VAGAVRRLIPRDISLNQQQFSPHAPVRMQRWWNVAAGWGKRNERTGQGPSPGGLTVQESKEERDIYAVQLAGLRLS